jgi:hypothetical protein
MANGPARRRMRLGDRKEASPIPWREDSGAQQAAWLDLGAFNDGYEFQCKDGSFEFCNIKTHVRGVL